MFNVRADLQKNRLYITLGEMAKGEPEKAANAVIAEMNKLEKGFTIINDITELKVLDEADQIHILRAQEYALQCGVSRAVRVVGKSIFPQMQMNRKSKEAGYNADFFPTVADAEKALESC